MGDYSIHRVVHIEYRQGGGGGGGLYLQDCFGTLYK